MRLPDWEFILSEWLDAHRHTPFEWGKFDCFTMAVLASDAITGNSHAAQCVDQYSTEQDAYALADSKGGFAQLFDLGYCRCNPNTARRGDVVLVAHATGMQSYAVKLAAGVALAGKNGVTIYTRKQFDIISAWRIE